MGKKKTAKRSKTKSFVKACNYNHLMPTRYSMNIPLDKIVINKDIFRDPALKCKDQREAKLKFKVEDWQEQVILPEAAVSDLFCY